MKAALEILAILLKWIFSPEKLKKNAEEDKNERVQEILKELSSDDPADAILRLDRLRNKKK